MLFLFVLIGFISLFVVPVYIYTRIKEQGRQRKAFLKETLFFIIIPFLISFLCFSLDFWAKKGIISLKIETLYIVENIDYILFYLSMWCILSMIISIVAAMIHHFKTNNLNKTKQFPALIYTLFFCAIFMLTIYEVPRHTNSTFFKYIVYPLNEFEEDNGYSNVWNDIIKENNVTRVRYVADGVTVYFFENEQNYHSSKLCPKLDEEKEKYKNSYKKDDYENIPKRLKPCEICVPQKGKPIPEYDY